MVFLIRIFVLLVLVVSITLFGVIGCLFTLKSKNRMYVIARIFSKVSSVFGLSVEGRVSEAASQVPQAVYIANHQNNFDLFTMAKVFPKGTVTVGKKSLLFIPFFGALYWASGNILINRNNRKKAIATIDQVVAGMKRTQLSIWMFPEGTRSRGRGWLPFKRGAFHAAVQAGVPIIPVVCSSTHNQVSLGRFDNGKVIIEMLDPVDTTGLHETDVVHLLEQCEEKMHLAKQCLDDELAKL